MDDETRDERDAALDALDGLFRPAVAEALAEESEPERTAALVAVLLAVFLLMYGENDGDEASADALSQLFVLDMESTLARLVPDGTEAQTDRMVSWMSTATMNAALMYAVNSNAGPEAEVVKTWYTQRDDRVRDIHQSLDGTTVAFDEPFVVKSDPPSTPRYPGEPVGPPEAWINCRCFMDVTTATVTAAIEPEVVEDAPEGEAPAGFRGVVIVALPEGDNTVTYNDGDTTEVHQTIVYLGTLDDLQEGEGDAILAVTEYIAAQVAPFTAMVIGAGTLGPDADAIVLTEADELQRLHDLATGDELIWDIYEERNNHPTWISHISGDSYAPGDEVRFDRVAAWFGGDNHVEFPLTGEGLTASRGPGWVTDPVETKRIHDYWTKPGEEGYAKIRWGTDGDFTRMARALRKYLPEPLVHRTAAEWHHDALGYWPGTEGMPGNNPKGTAKARYAARVASIEQDTITEVTDMTDFAPLTIVAAAPPAGVDRTLFDDPKFDRPTAIQASVTDDGVRTVKGHIATWDVCHIGIDKKCVTAPRSNTNYAHFHLGSVLTADGEISAGALTLGTGHAGLNASVNETRHHYDHTGTMVASVRAGEDEHGIWVAGVICDGVTDEQVRTLMASGGISGDWRNIGGNLELVAALAVNVPGFPVQRPALAASGERELALVAAGVVINEGDLTIAAVADAVVASLDRRDSRRAKLANLESIQAEARAKRVAALQEV